MLFVRVDMTCEFGVDKSGSLVGGSPVAPCKKRAVDLQRSYAHGEEGVRGGAAATPSERAYELPPVIASQMLCRIEPGSTHTAGGVCIASARVAQKT